MKISHVRKIMIKSHFGLIMAIAMLLVSCTKDKTIGDLTTPKVNDNITSSARAQGTSDEDVFQGVMFLEGPVAAKLSDLNDFSIRNLTSDQQQIQSALDFQKQVIKKLKNNNPNYLKNFRAKIGSGDYYTVKAAIEQATTDIFNVTLLSSGKSKNEIISNAKTLSDNFKSKHHLSESSSKEEILAALKSDVQPQNSIKGTDGAPPSVAISVYVYAYTGVVIAIMIMLVLTVGIAQEGGAGGIGRASSNNFLNDSFLSEVTLNLSHI